MPALGLTLRVGVPQQTKDIPSFQEFVTLTTNALKTAGHSVTAIETPLQRGYEMMSRGQIDAIIFDDQTRTEHRNQLRSISFPILFAEARIYYRSDNRTFSMEALPRLRGLVTLNNAVVLKKSSEDRLTVQSVGSTDMAIKMLMARRADYMIMTTSAGEAAIKKGRLQGQVISWPEVWLKFPVYFTINKKHESLLPALEQGFKKELKENRDAYPRLKKYLNRSP